jgi:hypothetical protein
MPVSLITTTKAFEPLPKWTSQTLVAILWMILPLSSMFGLRIRPLTNPGAVRSLLVRAPTTILPSVRSGSGLLYVSIVVPLRHISTIREDLTVMSIRRRQHPLVVSMRSLPSTREFSVAERRSNPLRSQRNQVRPRLPPSNSVRRGSLDGPAEESLCEEDPVGSLTRAFFRLRRLALKQSLYSNRYVL